MKNLIMISALVMTKASVSQAKESKSPEAQAINTACAADAVTAKCDGEKVGTGLLKCLHTYKKANPTTTYSTGCVDAMKAGHKARRASK